MTDDAARHDINCEWQFEQYSHECTCGVSRPRAPWFQPSTRDPARAGFKAAMLVRLHDRLKLDAEVAEPGCSGWRQAKARVALLHDLIADVERMQG